MERTGDITMMESPGINLHALPDVVLEKVINFLDAADVMALSMVNKDLHSYLSLNHDTLWIAVLREKMAIEYSKRHTRSPYEEVTHKAQTQRCISCNSFQPKLIKRNAIFRFRLCEACVPWKFMDQQCRQWMVISRMDVLKGPFGLDETDLRPLRKSNV